MVAEIKGTGAQTLTALDPALRKVGGATPAPSTAAPKDGDVVTLTDLAARLQRLTEAVAQLPEVDQTRVAELKGAIDRGEYRIDDRQVADKLAAFERLLSGGGESR